MQEVSVLVDNVIDKLKNNQLFCDCIIIREYPSKYNVPKPIKKTHIAIGVNQFNLLPCGFSDYMGTDFFSKEMYGKRAEIILKGTVYSAIANGGNSCDLVFYNICEALIVGRDKDYSIDNIRCEKVSYNSDASCYEMPFYIKFYKYFVQRSDENE